MPTPPNPYAQVAVTLGLPAAHLSVQPGAEIILRGSFRSTIDGSVIDATATALGPPGADEGGLIDLEAGGFHVTARDLATHEVHAIATEGPSPTCTALGVQSPCLPLRISTLAHSRLLTIDQLLTSLQGSLTAEMPYVPPVMISQHAVRSGLPIVAALVSTLMILATLYGVLSWVRQRARSPSGRLSALADRVKYKADRADPALAAPLMPAVEAALGAMRARRIDAGSAQGQRVAATLERLESRLDDKAVAAREEAEREVADGLIEEMDAAVRAAEEAHLVS